MILGFKFLLGCLHVHSVVQSTNGFFSFFPFNEFLDVGGILVSNTVKLRGCRYKAKTANPNEASHQAGLICKANLVCS